MMAVPFDTLKMADRLEAAGFTLKQAKAQAEAFAEVVSEESSRLATKQDIENLRLEVKALVSDSKADLVRWVVGVGLLQMALIAGLVLKLVG